MIYVLFFIFLSVIMITIQPNSVYKHTLSLENLDDFDSLGYRRNEANEYLRQINVHLNIDHLIQIAKETRPEYFV